MTKPIVCLGWGSLIWCQKTLPVCGDWQPDGPVLSVEFARESRDKRITLVICNSAPATTMLWAVLDVLTLADAKDALAVREGVKPKNVQHSIGFWSPAANSDHLGVAAIGEWAQMRGFEGVVWTTLKPKIGNKYRTPTQQEVVDHLGGLEGLARETAEEYVRLAPRQIRTPYRIAIENALSWTPNGLV